MIHGFLAGLKLWVYILVDNTTHSFLFSLCTLPCECSYYYIIAIFVCSVAADENVKCTNRLSSYVIC